MKTLVLGLSLFIVQSAFAITAKDTDYLTDLLNQRTMGADAFYAKIISGSQSLDTDKSKAERIEISNKAMLAEVETVISTFMTSPSADVVANVYRTVGTYDADVAGAGGHITFLGTNPSAAITRNLFLLPKAKLNFADPALEVMSILTSYKHSAKPSDFVYEYADAKNLTAGAIIAKEGSETSWLKPEAGTSFNENQDYVLKKCRQLLGWRCVTSLYHAETVINGDEKTHVLFVAIYDLENNKDHADFAKDKRSKNQITGSTAIYIVKETAEWVMLYGMDYQYNNDKTSFAGAIQTELKKDVDRFKERLSADLAIPVKEIK